MADGNRQDFYELLTLMREEMDRRENRMASRLDDIQDRQDICRKKLESWEQGAAIFKWLVIATTGSVATIAAAWDWWRNHFHG